MPLENMQISDFFQNAVEVDFARDFLFRIIDVSIDGGLELDSTDLLFAKAGKLPARQIVNQQVKYAGQTFNIPGSVEYPGSENYQIDFYCDEESDIRNRLLDESVRTFDSISGILGSGQSAGGIANANSTLTMVQLNKVYNVINTIKLIGVSIREVGEVNYNIAEGNGAVMSFNVGLAYHFFEYESGITGASIV